MTGNEIIREALEELRVIDAHDPNIDANTLAKGQRVLNSQLDEWKTRRLFIYQVVRHVVSYTATTASMTIGAGGQWNIARPVFIERANFYDSAALAETPLDVLQDREWAAISQKAMNATRPSAIWYDNTVDAPGPSGLGSVYLWPVPSADGALALYLPTAIAEITNFTDELYIPPGYRNAIIFTLAEDLAGPFNRTVSDDLRRKATRARGNLERLHSQAPRISTDMSAGDSGGNFEFETRLYR